MRTTLHLIPAEDAGWMLALFEPRNGGFARRRLAQLGLPEAQQQRAMRSIEGWLADEGPLARPALRERLERAGLVPQKEAQYHLWLLATTEGIACLGPDSGPRTRLALARDWLGELPRRGREESLGELARRYLRAFGPATDRDMARWSGLGLREVRAGFERIARELVSVEVAGVENLALKRGRPRPPSDPPVRLLGDWDTYLLGYADREFMASPPVWEKLKRGGGGFLRPTVVADGVVVGGWRIERTGEAARVTVEPYAKLTAAQWDQIEAEVADIGRFEGIDAALA